MTDNNLVERAEVHLDLGMRMGHMTDSPANIYRIAADLLIAVKADASRIEALEAERDARGLEAFKLRNDLDRKTTESANWRRLHHGLEARLDQAVEALRPFAAVGETIHKRVPDSHPMMHTTDDAGLEAGAFRRARTVLTSLEAKP